MATIGQARALLTDRTDFWDAFRINRHIATLRELNLDAQELAERALARDPRNMMAHSILARQYTILGLGSPGRRIMGAGCQRWWGRRVDRDPLRRRLQELLPDVVRPRCRAYLSNGAVHRADRPHARVCEISGTVRGRVLRGDRGLSGSLDRAGRHDSMERRQGAALGKLGVVVQARGAGDDRVGSREQENAARDQSNLHGETGEVTILAEQNPDLRWPAGVSESEPYKNVRGIGLGPWDYNRRMRDMVLRFAEPVRPHQADIGRERCGLVRTL